MSRAKIEASIGLLSDNQIRRLTKHLVIVWATGVVPSLTREGDLTDAKRACVTRIDGYMSSWRTLRGVGYGVRAEAWDILDMAHHPAVRQVSDHLARGWRIFDIRPGNLRVRLGHADGHYAPYTDIIPTDLVAGYEKVNHAPLTRIPT